MNIKDLRNKMTNIFTQLEERKIDINSATTFTKIASSILSTTNVEINYSKLHKTRKKIDFLEYVNEPKPERTREPRTDIKRKPIEEPIRRNYRKRIKT